ncbi:MAG TPA: DUF1573 domain-containing protein [Methylomirabilota bacterium]|nr:DUF1573 domain-containing protein [Methylomirabilota bacterium]
MLTQAFGQALDKVPPAPPTPPPPPKLPPVPNVRTNRDVAAILAAARAKASNAPAQTLTATQVPPQNLVQALSAPAPVATPAIATPPTAIVWDSEFKEKTASYGDTNAVIVFWLTNTSSAEVVVNSVRPSCGCTVAKLPSQPWRIGPGESGPIEASLDLRGKSGTLTKSLYVDSSSGPKTLLFKVTIPDRQGAISMSDPDRIRNVQLATADRQVVFKNADCAKCHAEPAHGKFGAQLYQAACAICHDTPHRATMVPDLRALKHPTNADTWRAWIKYGRVGSLMPAFDQSQGGPLTDDQIESLVNYLVQTIPSAPLPAAVPAKASPTAAAGTDHSATHTVSGAR